jgi:hypothetical protein
VRGEKFRKATPADYRWFSGFFVLVPIFMGVGVWILGLTNTTNVYLLWSMMTGLSVVFIAGCYFWSKYLPVKFSYTVGAIIWTTAFLFAWHLA